jgi:Flp pilus assembly pilin Flp
MSNALISNNGHPRQGMLLQDRNIDVKPPKGSPCRRKRSSRGQTLVEYALILAFISVVAISVLIRLGNQVKLVFSTITSQLAVAGSSH